MVGLIETVKTTLDSVRKGLKGLEEGLEEFEKKVLRSLESSAAWLNQVRLEFPDQIKDVFAKVSTRVGSPLAFATKEDLRTVIAKVEEFEARLDGSFRDTPASKKARVAAKA
jgi:hypothetical protein